MQQNGENISSSGALRNADTKIPTYLMLSFSSRLICNMTMRSDVQMYVMHIQSLNGLTVITDDCYPSS